MHPLAARQRAGAKAERVARVTVDAAGEAGREGVVVQAGVAVGDGLRLGEGGGRGKPGAVERARRLRDATSTSPSVTSTVPAPPWRTAIVRSSGGGVRSRTETAGTHR